MGILQKFKLVIHDNDFVEVSKSKDGTTAWFSKASSDMRLCVDAMTSSATVFWTTGPAQLGSKTFRTISSLRDWLALSAETDRAKE